MLWLCFFTASLLVAGYYLCRIYSGNAKTGFLGALTIWLFAGIGLSVRPQMIGYLLLVVECLLLHLGRTRTPRWFLGLPPLFAIWVNCHGSFFSESSWRESFYSVLYSTFGKAHSLHSRGSRIPAACSWSRSSCLLRRYS
jgi:hypothetical protein